MLCQDVILRRIVVFIFLQMVRFYGWWWAGLWGGNSLQQGRWAQRSEVPMMARLLLEKEIIRFEKEAILMLV